MHALQLCFPLLFPLPRRHASMSLCRILTRRRLGILLQHTVHCRSSTSRSSVVNSTINTPLRAFPIHLSRKSLQSNTSFTMAFSVAAMTTDSALRQRAKGAAFSVSAGAAPSTHAYSTRSSSSNGSHSHSHSHSHTHSHSGDSEEAAALAAAFSGSNDRGSRIILLGLASNVALTAAKGVGGVMLHSASLLADAGHSLSDLLGDIVVLFSWRLSRRPASRAFQYGYGASALLQDEYEAEKLV